MVFELFRGTGESQVESIESEVELMLSTTSETLSLALDALTRRQAPDEVGNTLRQQDKSINKVERAIRRQLIVHAGVRGVLADAPVLFIYMAIAKDIERVGDLAKDLWKLADAGADMSQGELREVADAVGTHMLGLIDDTARIFRERANDDAIEILNQADEAKYRYGTALHAQLNGADARVAVSLALFYRYVTRITAHLMNVLTAVVMPFERLDYWDEDKIDRED